MFTECTDGFDGEHATFRSTVSAKKGEWQLALAVVALSLVAFRIAAPIARMPLAPVAAFTPAYEAALATYNLILLQKPFYKGELDHQIRSVLDRA